MAGNGSRPKKVSLDWDADAVFQGTDTLAKMNITLLAGTDTGNF